MDGLLTFSRSNTCGLSLYLLCGLLIYRLLVSLFPSTCHLLVDSIFHFFIFYLSLTCHLHICRSLVTFFVFSLEDFFHLQFSFFNLFCMLLSYLPSTSCLLCLVWWPSYLPFTCILLICLRLVICFFTYGLLLCPPHVTQRLFIIRYNIRIWMTTVEFVQGILGPSERESIRKTLHCCHY